MSFPLLRLPYLAQIKVFQHLTLLEILHISKFSAKAKYTVQALKIRLHQAQLVLNSRFQLKVQYLETWYAFSTVEEINYEAPLNKEKNIVFIAEDPLKEVLNIFKQLQEIFLVSYDYVHIEADYFKVDQVELMCAMISNTSFQKVSVGFDQSEKLERLLQVFTNPIKNLTIENAPNRYDPPKLNVPMQSVKCEILTLQCLYWLKLPQLMAFDFITAKIPTTEISSSDTNVFLKSWRDGKTHQRMEKFEFSVDNANLVVIFEGISDNRDALDSGNGEIRVEGEDGRIATVHFMQKLCSILFVITVNQEPF